MAVVDVMRVLQAKALAQTAADAAALGAARELAIPSASSPTEEASRFALLNGAALVSCSCESGSAEAIVEVTVTARLLFLGGSRSVAGRARAVVEGPYQSGMGTMAPDARIGADLAATGAWRGRLHLGQASPPP